MSLKFETSGFTVVERKLRTLPTGIRKGIVNSAGRVLLRHVKLNIQLGDHSLKDLQVLGHPYARRHGSISLHADRPYAIHTHTNTLLGALEGFGLDRQNVYIVRFNPAKADYAKYVIEGTRKLLPRDVIWQTAFEPRTTRAMSAEIVADLWVALKKHLGTI